MAALNVQSYPLRPWSLFADHLDYTKQYWACYFDGDTPGEPHYNYSMIPIYNKVSDYTLLATETGRGRQRLFVEPNC